VSAENEAIKAPTPEDRIEPMPRPARIETMKATTLRLTTTGRKSGQERSIVIGYLEGGPNLISTYERLGRGTATFER
jgi:hypothetical protein